MLESQWSGRVRAFFEVNKRNYFRHTKHRLIGALIYSSMMRDSDKRQCRQMRGSVPRGRCPPELADIMMWRVHESEITDREASGLR